MNDNLPVSTVEQEAEKLFEQAFDLQNMRRFNEASGIYRDLIQKFPTSNQAAMARLKIKNFGKYMDTPGKEFHAGLETKVIDNLNTEVKKAKDLYERAFDLQFRKRFREASARYQQLVQQFPDSEQATIARQQIKNLGKCDDPPAAEAPPDVRTRIAGSLSGLLQLVGMQVYIFIGIFHGGALYDFFHHGRPLFFNDYTPQSWSGGEITLSVLVPLIVPVISIRLRSWELLFITVGSYLAGVIGTILYRVLAVDCGLN